jgi:hypothetical protein
MSLVDRHDGAGLTAVVRLNGGRLQLVRHPADGRVVAFDDADAAFAFAVSLEIAGAQSAGTVAAPAGQPIHILPRGVSAADLPMPMEVAA